MSQLGCLGDESFESLTVNQVNVVGKLFVGETATNIGDEVANTKAAALGLTESHADLLAALDDKAEQTDMVLANSGAERAAWLSDMPPPFTWYSPHYELAISALRLWNYTSPGDLNELKWPNQGAEIQMLSEIKINLMRAWDIEDDGMTERVVNWGSNSTTLNLPEAEVGRQVIYVHDFIFASPEVAVVAADDLPVFEIHTLGGDYFTGGLIYPVLGGAEVGVIIDRANLPRPEHTDPELATNILKYYPASKNVDTTNLYADAYRAPVVDMLTAGSVLYFTCQDDGVWNVRQKFESRWLLFEDQDAVATIAPLHAGGGNFLWARGVEDGE